VLLNIRSASDVTVCCCATGDLGAEAIAAAVRLLSEDERSRLAELAFPEDRRDLRVAHALLRRTLTSYGGHAPHEWRFVRAGEASPK
jgi:phosphopantetheinyl transferase